MTATWIAALAPRRGASGFHGIRAWGKPETCSSVIQISCCRLGPLSVSEGRLPVETCLGLVFLVFAVARLPMHYEWHKVFRRSMDNRGTSWELWSSPRVKTRKMLDHAVPKHHILLASCGSSPDRAGTNGGQAHLKIGAGSWICCAMVTGKHQLY